MVEVEVLLTVAQQPTCIMNCLVQNGNPDLKSSKTSVLQVQAGTLTHQDLLLKFLYGPYNNYIRVYNKNLQNSRFW